MSNHSQTVPKEPVVSKVKGGGPGGGRALPRGITRALPGCGMAFTRGGRAAAAASSCTYQPASDPEQPCLASLKRASWLAASDVVAAADQLHAQPLHRGRASSNPRRELAWLPTPDRMDHTATLATETDRRGGLHLASWGDKRRTGSRALAAPALHDIRGASVHVGSLPFLSAVRALPHSSPLSNNPTCAHSVKTIARKDCRHAASEDRQM